MRRPETFLSFCCRLELAHELQLEPGELDYIGEQEGLGCRLFMFTVDKPGDRLHRSTRSVRMEV
jgi:hypothetical protein